MAKKYHPILNPRTKHEAFAICFEAQNRSYNFDEIKKRIEENPDLPEFPLEKRFRTNSVKVSFDNLERHPENLELCLRFLAAADSDSTWRKKPVTLRHYLWLISNHPEHLIFQYLHFFWKKNSPNERSVTRAWNEQLEKHPNNPRVLANASHAFLGRDPKRPDQLAEKAAKLAPNVPFIQELNFFHKRCNLDISGGRKCLIKAVKAGEDLFKSLKKKSLKADCAIDIAIIAAWANKEETCFKYASYANKNLEAKQQYYWRKHKALFCLAWCAYIKGNPGQVRKLLNEAGEIKISLTDGPDPFLCHQLITGGYKEEILDFIEKCSLTESTYWDSDETLKLIKSGNQRALKYAIENCKYWLGNYWDWDT